MLSCSPLHLLPSCVILLKYNLLYHTKLPYHALRELLQRGSEGLLMAEVPCLNFLVALHGKSPCVNGPTGSAVELSWCWEAGNSPSLCVRAQGSAPPGKAVGMSETLSILWLGSTSSAGLSWAQAATGLFKGVDSDSAFLHTKICPEAPEVCYPCSCRVVPHPANNPAEIKTKRFSMRFK